MSLPHIPSDQYASLPNFLQAYGADWDFVSPTPIDAIKRGLEAEQKSDALAYLRQLHAAPPSKAFLEDAFNTNLTDEECSRFLEEVQEALEAAISLGT